MKFSILTLQQHCLQDSLSVLRHYDQSCLASSSFGDLMEFSLALGQGEALGPGNFGISFLSHFFDECLDDLCLIALYFGSFVFAPTPQIGRESTFWHLEHLQSPRSKRHDQKVPTSRKRFRGANLLHQHRVPKLHAQPLGQKNTKNWRQFVKFRACFTNISIVTWESRVFHLTFLTSSFFQVLH